MKEFNDKNIQDAIDNSKKPLVIVYCWGTSCGPCKMYSPILEDIFKMPLVEVDIFKINVEENGIDFRNKYSVRSLPTLLVFKKNLSMPNTPMYLDEVIVGLQPRIKILNILEKLLTKLK